MRQGFIPLSLPESELRPVFGFGYIVYSGMWLSLVERCVRDAKAAGSNPVIPTILQNLDFQGFAVIQFECQSGCSSQPLYPRLSSGVYFKISTKSLFSNQTFLSGRPVKPSISSHGFSQLLPQAKQVWIVFS